MIELGTIEVKCPKCGIPQTVNLSNPQSKLKQKCRGCGTLITYAMDSQSRRNIENVNKSLRDLEKALKLR